MPSAPCDSSRIAAAPIGRPPAGVEKDHYVHALFDRISARYDLFNTLASFGMHQSWRRRAIAAARLRPGMQVLDVGAGTGDLTLMAAEAVSPTGMVTALDLSEPMLHVAARKAAQTPAGYHVRMLQGRAERLPAPDDTFDAVISGFVMRNVSDLGATLAESHRVLACGGRLVILEFSRPRVAFIRLGHTLWLLTGAPLLGWLATGACWPFAYLRHSIAGFFRPEEFMAQLRSQGFSDVTAAALLGGAVMIYRGVKV